MSKLIDLIKALLPNLKSRKELEDAYLREAVDIYDLEHRMQALNLRSSSFSAPAMIVGAEGR